MNQVKFRVRCSALLLREFTAAELIRITGLNPESVRTELQRMKGEGLLIARLYPIKSGKRGGRQALYRLSNDPEARLRLSKSIEAFYPALPPSDRPTSRYYLSAQRYLTQAQNTFGADRKLLLDDAERDLEIAEQAEGGSLASEPIRATLQYERARLAYLRGKYAEAKQSFEASRAFFVSIRDESMVKRIDETQLCLEACSNFAESRRGEGGEAAWAHCLLAVLDNNAFQSDSPLILLLLHLLRCLSQRPQEAINAATAERFEQFMADTKENFSMLRKDTAILLLGQLASRQNAEQRRMPDSAQMEKVLTSDHN